MNSDTPEVTVVLPVFNAADTITRAVQSILAQSHHDLELVVVDDGSTDGTRAALDQIRDSRMRVISQRHQGVAAAANAGTQAAQSPFLARMDADDFSAPQRIEKQLGLLKATGLDVAGCRVRILNGKGESVQSMHRYERWINSETIREDQIASLRFVELPLVNPTILARRKYFELGFLDNEFPEDYDLMLRAAQFGLRFGKVGEVLLDWTDRPDRLTRTNARYTTSAFQQCRRFHLLAGPLRNQRRVDLWGIGQTGKPWLRWLQKQGIEVRQGYDLAPRKIGSKVHGLTISHPADLLPADGTPLIIAVGADAARSVILPQLAAQNYVPGATAWFVA